MVFKQQQNQTQEKIVLLRGACKVKVSHLEDIYHKSRKYSPQGTFEILYLEASGGSANSYYETSKFIVLNETFLEFLNRCKEVEYVNLIFNLKKKGEKEYITLCPCGMDPRYLLWFNEAEEFHTKDSWDGEFEWNIYVENSSSSGMHTNKLNLFLLKEGNILYNDWSSYKGRQGEGTTKYIVTKDLELKSLGEMDGIDEDFIP